MSRQQQPFCDFHFHFAAVFVCSLLFFNGKVESRQLRLIQAIWRHGDRAPSSKPYPNDTHDANHWPRGWGQLTSIGIRQMNELGAFFRNRYVDSMGFIQPTFQRQFVRFRSSDADRAIESAHSFAAGLFPPLEGVDGETSWQQLSFPIHTSGEGVADPLLRPTHFKCPKYLERYARIEKEVNDVLKEKYKDVVNFIEPILGVIPGENLTVKRVNKLFDLNREIIHGLPQPEWVHMKWPKHGNATTLAIVNEMRRIARLSKFIDPELAKYRGGWLLGDWMFRAVEFIGKVPVEQQKMVLYSAHDGTLLSLLYALRVADNDLVPYAACVIMELYETQQNQFTVEFYYRKNRILKRLRLKGCEENCSLVKFIKLFNANAIFDMDELKKNCGIQTKAETKCDLSSNYTESEE